MQRIRRAPLPCRTGVAAMTLTGTAAPLVAATLSLYAL